MRSRRTLYAGWAMLIGGIAILLALFAAGCATVPHGTTPPAPSVTHPFASMTQALSAIDSLMGVVYALSVVAFGLGIVLMFYLHTSLGPALMAGGIGTLILSLFVKSLIWFVPWIAGGIILVGGIAFVVDARKRGFKAALLDVRNAFGLPEGVGLVK